MREASVSAQQGLVGTAASLAMAGEEHSPLVRLSAVLYFMTSSMLVQFTTKVRAVQLCPPAVQPSAITALFARGRARGCGIPGPRLQRAAIAGPSGRHGCSKAAPARNRRCPPPCGGACVTRLPACGLMAGHSRACAQSAR